MNHPDLIRLARVTALLLALACAGQASAQTTAFTYQGRLTANGLPANGTYELRFDLRDAPTAGTAVGTAVNNSGVAVSNGVFTVTVDFGAGAFTGANRWLEIGVRTNGSVSAYAVLTPRQPVTSAPHAVQAVNAQTAASVTGTVPATSVSGTFTSGQIPNLDAAKITSGTVADTRLSANVALLNGSPTFAGTVTATTFVGSGAFTWQTVSGTAQQAAANTGYLATNDTAQVTITLPAAPNVGEVVRVSGVGEGGWKVAQNEGQTILGANLGLIGVSWTARENNRNWTSVASSADGSKLVAVVQNGQIYTSTDSGVTWTARANFAIFGTWQSVASSADGSKLVAVVSGGQIYTSTDSGVTWITRDGNRTWQSVASAADGSKLVAVVGGVGGGQIYTSTDSGVTWTARNSGSRRWWSVASSADGSKLVAVVLGGQIYTSTGSGVTWTARNSDRSWTSVASSADGSKLVAVVNGGQIYTSTDSGVTWTARESNRQWYSVASSADGSKLVAGDYSGQIYTSTDSGVTWTARDSNRNWQSVASSADGSKLVAVGYGGLIYTSHPNSTTGTAGSVTGGPSATLELQYIGNNRFLPLSWAGTFQAN